MKEKQKSTKELSNEARHCRERGGVYVTRQGHGGLKTPPADPLDAQDGYGDGELAKPRERHRSQPSPRY